MNPLQQLYSRAPLSRPHWADSSDFAYINSMLLELSISLLAVHLHGDVIDVGCGTQPYRQYLTEARTVTACDFDGGRGDVDFICPAHDIPKPSESFDGVLCTEVLEHVPDPVAVWKEFFRILRPGGHVLVSTPMYWPSHEQPYDFYRYPEHGLRHLAKTAGFEVEVLLPRGGMWAFLGQASMHVLHHYLPFRFMRRAWNKLFVSIDRSRCNPMITIGWTVLVTKRKVGAQAAESASATR
jgi:SAM-dependent methyltransferase